VSAGPFLEPRWLPFLLLAPAVWALLAWADRRRARRALATLGPRHASLADASPVRRLAGRAAFALGVLFALLALAGPSFSRAEAASGAADPDVVLCLDVSRSMRAQDLRPDRLARARQEVLAFATAGRAGRVALVAFAGEARLLVPLTTDGQALARIADLADPSSVARGGTDLAAALDAARGALGGPGTAVLLTDGEDLGGAGLEAAERCRAEGILVHAVGFGTPGGSAVRVPEGDGTLRDRRGAAVVSALDAAGLERIAAATGGAYADGGTAGALLGLPEGPRRGGGAAPAAPARRDVYAWPLLLAILCFAADLAVGDRRRR
jgi:Ca-activated chloride channel family protein